MPDNDYVKNVQLLGQPTEDCRQHHYDRQETPLKPVTTMMTKPQHTIPAQNVGMPLPS